MMGNAFTFTGDFSKALEAAGRVFELLDRKPKIDANHSVGLKLNQVEGKLRIRDGEFSYPTRKDIQVSWYISYKGWQVRNVMTNMIEI